MVARGSDFGQVQEQYIRRARVTISKAKQMLREAVEKKGDLGRFFSELLIFLASERRSIAFDHGTPYAKEFGSRRDLEGSADVSYTYFAGGYAEYGRRIMQLLKNHLSKMEQQPDGFVQKKMHLEESCFGRRSSFDIEIFEREEIKNQGLCQKVDRSLLPEDFPFDLLEIKVKSREEELKLFKAFRSLRQKLPQQYANLRMASLMLNLMKDFPSPFKAENNSGAMEWVGDLAHLKSTYILATTSLEIEGKMEPIFQYLTWAYRDPEHPEENLLDRMCNLSTLMVIHQHESLIENTIRDMGSTFAKAIQWDGKDLSILKKLVALLRYEMACMPFSRGTAAISEWIEAAIYEYHGIKYQADPNRLVDLEAYASPFFSDFLNSYDGMIQLNFQKKQDLAYTYLDELALQAGTHKSSKYHNYTEIYSSLFDKIKNEPLKLLEIGIGSGESVLLWEKYFPNADLHFLDIEPASEFLPASERFHYYQCDQGNPLNLIEFAKKSGGNFDVIIDDGGHEMEQQQVSFKTLFPHLKKGGMYIIEDLHTSYWAKYGGGGTKLEPCPSATSTTEFLKKLIDELNFIGASTGSANHQTSRDIQPMNIYQRDIFSLTFYDSLCVITKR
jgi:hypothetical protein